MTKHDLIEEVARVTEMPRWEAAEVIDVVLASMAHAVRSGDKVEIRNFGSFRTRSRRPRIGRNPATGASVQVPARTIAYFKPSKELREPVNSRAVEGIPN